MVCNLLFFPQLKNRKLAKDGLDQVEEFLILKIISVDRILNDTIIRYHLRLLQSFLMIPSVLRIVFHIHLLI